MSRLRLLRYLFQDVERSGVQKRVPGWTNNALPPRCFYAYYVNMNALFMTPLRLREFLEPFGSDRARPLDFAERLGIEITEHLRPDLSGPRYHSLHPVFGRCGVNPS